MKCILGKIKPVGANCVRQEKIGTNNVGAIINRQQTKIDAKSVGANCVRPKIELSYIGQIVENEINNFNNIYEYVRIDKYVIMPNHIHMIIMIERPDWRTQFAPTVSRIIKQFKGSITKQLGYSIWQRSYYDHIIRNKNDYTLIYKYIEENPNSWIYDKYFSE